MEYKNVIKNVLDRHKDGQGNIGSDSFRDMLSVEISSNLELEDNKKEALLQKRSYEFIQNEMSQGEKEHQDAWSRGKAIDNPLSPFSKKPVFPSPNANCGALLSARAPDGSIILPNEPVEVDEPLMFPAVTNPPSNNVRSPVGPYNLA